MSTTDPSVGAGGSESSDWAVRNLKDQVRHLEAVVLTLDSELAALRMIAAERKSQADALPQQLDQSSEEHRRELEATVREATRAMKELAARELALTRENLELRTESLLHSVFRRLQQIFS